MRLLTAILILASATAIFAKPQKPNFGLNLKLNTRKQPAPNEFIERYGYPSETHYITTEDNYILTVYRIPHGKNQEVKEGEHRTPVLIVHGLASSSSDFLTMGPERNLPYILADDGYDVWITNARGTTWSRNHTTLDPTNPKDQKAFFDFSWHEIGVYDHPATIDYILKETGSEKIEYVGHSQGGTSFLVMTSDRLEYNDKIQLATLLAPATFMAHEFALLEVIGVFIDEIDLALKLINLHEFPFVDVINFAIRDFCPIHPFRPVCNFILGLIFGGSDYEQTDWDNIATVAANFPSRLSIKQLMHYGQEVKRNSNTTIRYGRKENLIRYGQEKPPEYDLSKVTAPVSVYYGLNDQLAHYEDALTLIRVLPNLVKGEAVPYAQFDHLDFVIAKDVVELLYNNVVADIENSEHAELKK